MRSPTRSHETEGTKKGESAKSTVIKPDGYTVPARLGLEPAGCTNEAYIVRLDSMESGNGVCCGATRVFGAYVTDFLLILCAPKRLLPCGDHILLGHVGRGSLGNMADVQEDAVR